MNKQNKTVLITGATSGTGLSLAKEFASHGYDIVIVARRQTELERVSEELNRQYGIDCSYICADLGKVNSALEVYDHLIDRGLEIDILINNAGVGDSVPFLR